MLTHKQKEFVIRYLSSPSLDVACKESGIDRRTFYNWMKREEFRNYLEEKERQIIDEAIFRINVSLNKAVDILVDCMADEKDKRLKRLASKDIIEYFLKLKELTDIEGKIKEIEERLSQLEGGKK